jgi:membrane protease YdiL (CAAX protease family)
MLHGDTTEILEVAEVLLVGFYEELIVRAYLMTEIIALTRSAWLAVVVSVVVQSSYHFYQGVPLALSHVLLFTVYALFYVRTRMVLPLALAHSVADINAVWSYGLKTMSFG